jgi:spermidine/putrescine transport system substrate-binding protein
MNDDVDPAFLRGITQARFSRRKLLRAAGAGAAGAGLMGFLDACGIAGTRGTGAENVNWSVFWAQQHKAGVLDWANWPLYIDSAHGGDHPSIDLFTKRTGIKVNYRAVIQDNPSFFAQISPVLAAGQSIGYDLIVISDGWELTQLIQNRWLIPLDQSRMPNFHRYAGSIARDPPFDPGNRYSASWQSGLTGIAYDPRMTGREITSVKDLWDPKFRGRVGMMSDNTDLGSAGLLYLGIDPATSKEADWEQAAGALRKQRGLVRGYYDQRYINALERGDTWISQAWSGDIFQANASGHPELRFVVPEEGVMHWTDNMMVPRNARNPLSAMAWMNYYYQPRVAAMVADWVEYITPVPDAQPILEKSDPAVGRSSLVFPTPAMSARARNYPTFSTRALFDAWNGNFDPIIKS